jgi:16S rRNA (uracil1498-N3)-methyltransferase
MVDLSYSPKIRLYFKNKLECDQILLIENKQFHYLINVMRKKNDDCFFIFNEIDGEFIAKITAINKKKLTINILQKLKIPEKPSDIWVIFAPVKKNATDIIIQKSTELGASRIIPVLTERTITRKINLKRMEDIAIESSEQSERVTIPEIMPIQDIAKVMSKWDMNRKIYYGDETIRYNKDNTKDVLQQITHASGAILIGPEGGFSMKEINFLKSKSFVIPINFGPRVLRSDTAVISGLVFWHIINGDMKNYSQNNIL